MSNGLKLKASFITKTKDNRLHQLSIPVIGLTGGIASGKSSAAALFRQQQMAVIDADSLIKKIYSKDETKKFVQGLCPQALSDSPQGLVIDFKKLRQFFFSTPKAQTEIENYLYPQLKEAFLEDFALLGGEKKHSFVIYDVPLLFEKKLDTLVDTIICVYAPASVQKMRLIKRDKIDDNLALKILGSQMDIEEKKRLSNLVITNDQDQQKLEQEVQKVIQTLTVE